MKIFTVGNIRRILHLWYKDEISISRVAEMLNEIVNEHLEEINTSR